jgi:RNA polymerase sigma factor (sigma-70 family)
MTVSPLNLDFIAGFQRGSYESVKELYDQFYTDLAVFAENAVQQKPAAHDIVLETYIKLYRMRTQFNSLANIKAFLYITVRNNCQRYKGAAHGSTPWYTADGSVFNDETVRARAISQLCEEVEQLPEKCRRVFKLAYCSQMRAAEVAEQLDIDQPTTIQLRAKAFQQLRDNLYNKQLFSVPLFVYFLAVACAENC